jgi:hypothetical protein
MADRFSAQIITSTAARLNPGLMAELSAGGFRPINVIKDNAQFIDRVNLVELDKIITKPTRTIVVSQDPSPGDQVPAGTPVTLTLAPKDSLPLGVLGVSATLAGKFSHVAALESEVDKLPQAAKDVIVGTTEYSALSSGVKESVDSVLMANIPAAERAKVFDDIRFLVNL